MTRDQELIMSLWFPQLLEKAKETEKEEKELFTPDYELCKDCNASQDECNSDLPPYPNCLITEA